jgi:hypothetical protein
VTGSLDREYVERKGARAGKGVAKAIAGTYGAGPKTDADYRRDAAKRANQTRCLVVGCQSFGVGLDSLYCKAHKRVIRDFRIPMRALGDLEPMREGCCNWPRKGGVYRCRQTRPRHDGLPGCTYHKGAPPR